MNVCKFLHVYKKNIFYFILIHNFEIRKYFCAYDEPLGCAQIYVNVLKVFRYIIKIQCVKANNGIDS